MIYREVVSAMVGRNAVAALAKANQTMGGALWRRKFFLLVQRFGDAVAAECGIPADKVADLPDCTELGPSAEVRAQELIDFLAM